MIIRQAAVNEQMYEGHKNVPSQAQFAQRKADYYNRKSTTTQY